VGEDEVKWNEEKWAQVKKREGSRCTDLES
jgi:hypothetical protein